MMMQRSLQKTAKAFQPQAIFAAGMATEKAILEKMTSTKNITKITSSMKMVAASKLRGDQNRLEAGLPFGKWTNRTFGAAEHFEDVGEELDTSKLEGNSLFIPIASDKGLCGGINSGIAKQVRFAAAKLNADGKEFKTFIIGEKGRPPLANNPIVNPTILTSVNNSWTVPTNFAQVSALAMEVASVPDIDNYVMFYNRFDSVIAYTVSAQTVPAISYDAEAEEMDPVLGDYEVEPEDRAEVMESLSEFTLACAMYSNFLDQACSFQSSQMTAMDNATTNANEVIETLNIQYNRARQARITTELIEIISGASALDG